MDKRGNDLLSAALHYAELGYAVFPCVPGDKAPLTEHGFKDASADSEVIKAWWARWPRANVGLATEGLLVVDIDGADNRWLADEPLKQRELEIAPISITPSGGRHHLFRQPEGKAWRNTARRIAPGVDTRANGGYIVGPPSLVGDVRYAWASGGLYVGPDDLPTPPDWLISVLDEITKPPRPPVRVPAVAATGDVENRAVAYLEAMPPAISGAGGHNATYAAATALVHGFGIDPDLALEILLAHYNPRCEPPWSEKELRHKVEDAATKPHDYPHGWLRDCAPATAANDVDLSAFLVKATAREDESPQPIEDPGPMPEELLRIPGFVSEVMDYCLETAPYPNHVTAFCGALSLQAFLAGRKVRDPGDNRTNLYLLGLAHSAAGKDWPRKVNTRIVHEAGLAGCLGERFASGEGIQDALFLTPSMLFQTDEIDGMLQSINKARDARHENVMTTLLTMYSASNSVFPMRRKAGKESPGAIDQPCLVIFGTAIPNHYYEALSERMLTNGFFARMLILESGPRPKGQEPVIRDTPASIIETARWWANHKPGPGNLSDSHPVPAIIEQTDEAKRLLVETREEAESEYARAEEKADPVGTTVWGRVSEQTRKLALIYSVSENHQSPVIGVAAVEWASRFVMHQTRRMLFMAQAHVAENPFDALCLKLIRKLKESPGQRMSHSSLLQRMHVKATDFRELIQTLVQRGDIEVVTTPRAGSAKVEYQAL